MTDKSPTPPDRPDPHLDPSDDTDEPAFDWMKPAAAGKPGPAAAAGTAAGPAAPATAAGKPTAGTAAGTAGSATTAGSAEGTAAPSAAPAASQPESRADRKAAEAAATGPSNTSPSDVATSNAATSNDEARGAGAGASAGARPDTDPEDEVERRNAERRNAEREQAAKAKPVLPRVLQVLLAVFYPVILLVLAVRAVTSPLFLWVEYNRPGFPGDGYGFSTDDRMTYGSYAVDYLSNWSGPRYLGDLVDQSGERLFKDGEVSHMADVKAVILSTFGAGSGGPFGARAGRYPPSACRRACMYFISALSSGGFTKRSFCTSSLESGTAKRSRKASSASSSSFLVECAVILPWPQVPMP